MQKENIYVYIYICTWKNAYVYTYARGSRLAERMQIIMGAHPTPTHPTQLSSNVAPILNSWTQVTVTLLPHPTHPTPPPRLTPTPWVYIYMYV